jgi:hypothetical protein
MWRHFKVLYYSLINVSHHFVCCFCYHSTKQNSGLRVAHQTVRQTHLVKKLNRLKYQKHFQKNAFWLDRIPFWDLTSVQAETLNTLLKEPG